jgi:hypothetical protein
VLLRFLPADRAQQYGQDLRDVDVAILTEKADQSERTFETASSAAERLRIARQIVNELGIGTPEETTSMEVAGRVKRLQDRWEARLRRATQEVGELEGERRRQRLVERRRRLLNGGWVLLLLVVLAVVWLVAQHFARPDSLQGVAVHLSQACQRAWAPSHSGGSVEFPAPASAIADLSVVTTLLDASVVNGSLGELPARAGVVRLAVERLVSTPGDVVVAGDELLAAIDALDGLLPALEASGEEAVRTVAAAVRRYGLRAREVLRNVAVQSVLAAGANAERVARVRELVLRSAVGSGGAAAEELAGWLQMLPPR